MGFKHRPTRQTPEIKRRKPAASLNSAIESLERYGPTKTTLLAALDACEHAADLDRVFNNPACEDGTYGESPFFGEVARRVAAKARAWSQPADVARAIMWLTRISAFAPNRLIAGTRSSANNVGVKERVARVSEGQLSEYRALCGDDASEIRVAATHALACCRTTTVADVALLERRWDQEKTRAVLATLILATGVVARRCADELGPKRLDLIRRRALTMLEHPDLVVRVCAVAAAGLLGEQLPRRAVETLSEAIASPRRLPPLWGWFWLFRRDDTSHFAAELCGWARVDEPDELVDSLLKARDKMPGLETVTNALMHCLFRDLPASGIALEELDDLQRRAIKSLEKHGHDGWEERLGLRAWQGTSRFLAGEHIAWRPLSIATEQGERRWHFLKVWKAFTTGELSESAAVNGIINGIRSAARVVDVVLEAGIVWSEPDQRLAIAIFEQLQTRGLDVVRVVTERRGRHTQNANAVVLAALAVFAAYRAGGEPMPEAHDELFAEAIEDLYTTSPFDELLSSISSARRERVLIRSTQALDDDWEWAGIKVAHVAFTEEVARFVVNRVLLVPEQFGEARQMLSRTGTRGRKLLAALNLQTEDQRETRDSLLSD